MKFKGFQCVWKPCKNCTSVSYFVCVSIWVCSGMFWTYSEGAQKYHWFSDPDYFGLMHAPWVTDKVLKIITENLCLNFHKLTFEVHDFSLVFLLHSCLPGTDSLVSWVGCQGVHIHQLPNVGPLLWEIESSVVTFEYFQPRRTAVLLMQLTVLLMHLSTSWNKREHKDFNYHIYPFRL